MFPFVKTKQYFFKQMMKMEYFPHSRNITGISLRARMTMSPPGLENILYNAVESEFGSVGDLSSQSHGVLLNVPL